jgi:N-acetylglucosaminyl-diphospho-decaprenol L-rhamnosyltransferase
MNSPVVFGQMQDDVRNARLEIIVVAYNSDDVLESCLRAVPDAVGSADFHVTVVDSASAVSPAFVIERSGLMADLFRMDENVGYAGANNFAINQILARQPEPDAIMIVNPDISLPRGSIRRLLSILLQSSNCGAISPCTTRSLGTPGTVVTRSLWGVPYGARAARGSVVSVDRVEGCCLLVRPAVFKRVGLFDEDYFLYWEEIDFCTRLRKAGYELLVTTDVTVVRGGEGALKKHRAYYLWRNQVLFAFRQFGPLIGLAFLLRRLFIGNVRESISYMAHGRMDLVAAGISGLWAGLRGKVGRSTSRFADSGPVFAGK